jgi:predicted enzyme related to lactoylglutathione lyase
MLDVAQLAHVELLTPDLDGTLRFFEDILGMRRPGGGVSRSTSGATRSSITIR